MVFVAPSYENVKAIDVDDEPKAIHFSLDILDTFNKINDVKVKGGRPRKDCFRYSTAFLVMVPVALYKPDL